MLGVYTRLSCDLEIAFQIMERLVEYCCEVSGPRTVGM